MIVPNTCLKYDTIASVSIIWKEDLIMLIHSPGPQGKIVLDRNSIKKVFMLL